MMLRTIQNISEFKNTAIHTHDNKKTASANWAKSWGMAYWFDVWFYNEFTLGSLVYRVGMVRSRHRSYRVAKFYIKDNDGRLQEVSEKEFFECAKTIEYKPKVTTPMESVKPTAQQLTLF